MAARAPPGREPRVGRREMGGQRRFGNVQRTSRTCQGCGRTSGPPRGRSVRSEAPQQKVQPSGGGSAFFGRAYCDGPHGPSRSQCCTRRCNQASHGSTPMGRAAPISPLSRCRDPLTQKRRAAHGTACSRLRPGEAKRLLLPKIALGRQGTRHRVQIRRAPSAGAI